LSIKKHIEAFNKTRIIKNPTTLCYAPEISLNFDQKGTITTCCFNRDYVLGKWPRHRISDIWNGRRIQKLRKALRNDSLSLGCGLCGQMLEDGNYESVLIKHFDGFAKKETKRRSFFSSYEETDKPTLFEFEISNTCNLECIMCGGHWSSAIRKNREGLPSIDSPYDVTFVEEIKEYIPTLKRANFLGGEPFLISIYYDIWESMVELNPGLEIAITSNGTTLTKRARKIIEKLTNCKITLSIDSVNKKTYESIRINGNFDQVYENIRYLLEAKKLVSFSVCPMIQNRYEIPEIIDFCIQQNIDIFFNIVYQPLGERIEGIHEHGEIKNKTNRSYSTGELIPETSLQFLSAEELDELIDLYSKLSYPKKYQERLDGLINQIKAWKLEKLTT